jgi:curved DNA-binding protein
MAPARDFYAALGVARGATPEEIQRAYRKLARTYHPDINKDPSAEERFKEVSEAYSVLSDPDTRRRYDQFGSDFRQVPDDVDAATWARFRQGARAGARAGPAGGSATGAGSGSDRRWSRAGEGVRFTADGGPDLGDVDLDDLLGGLFGGGAGARGWGAMPGADQEAELVLTVEEAYRGGWRTVTLPGPDGPRTYTVDVPPGVTDGQRIRLAGQGGRGSGSAASGDLYLVVRIAPHRRYRVHGRDLHVDLPLAPWEGALGATVEIDTPDGTAKVKVPRGTSSGRRLRLRGRGLPNTRGTPGDLFAEARVVVPSKPTPEETRLFEELAGTSKFDPRRQR